MTYFQILPAANAFFDEEANQQERSLAEESSPPAFYATSYAERVAQYQHELEPTYGTAVGPKNFPRHMIRLPGDEFTLVYDSTLYKSLLEIYILHGPEGIKQTYLDLQTASEDPITRYAYDWSAAKSFFLFTRNLLFLLIRQALNDIERKAWAVVYDHLSMTKIHIEEEIKKLKISVRKELVPDDSVTIKDAPRYIFKRLYTLGEPKLSNQLYEALTDAVDARYKVLEADARWKRAEKELKQSRLRGPDGQNGARGGPEDRGSTGGSGSGAGGGTGQSTSNVSKVDPTIIREWLLQAEKAAQSKFQKAFDLCPFAPSAVLLLKRGFSKPEMEQIFGEVIMQFLAQIDELGSGLKDSAG